MRQSNLQIVFGILIGAAIFYAIVTYRKLTTIPDLPISTNPFVIADSQTPEQVPNVASSQTPETTPKKNPAPTVTAVQSSHKGFCRYALPEKEMLISLSSLKMLQNQKINQKTLLLPRSHASCLKDGSYLAQVVEYEPSSDLAYAYYGKVGITLKKVMEFQDINILVATPGLDPKFLGFEAVKDIVVYLKRIGLEARESVFAFKVDFVSEVRPRDPVGLYTFYPGVKFVSASQAEQIKGKFYIDASDVLPKLEKLEIKKRPNASRLDRFVVLQPTAAISLAGDIHLDIPKSAPLVLLGRDASDRSPLNMIPTLITSRFSDINILSGGAASLMKYDLETPQEIPGLKTLKIDELAKDFRNYLVLDTRPDFGNYPVEIQSSKLAPINYGFTNKELWNDLVLFSKSRSFSLDHKIEKYLQVNDMVNDADSRPTLLVGFDEYDWRPLILFSILRKMGVRRLAWYRSGFADLENRMILRILPPTLNDQVIPGLKDNAAMPERLTHFSYKPRGKSRPKK